MNYILSKRSLKRLDLVNPLLIAIAVDSIHRSPYDFGIAWMGGFRTPEQQNKLFKDGKSKADGYNKKSYHQSGNAFDIVCYKDGHITWDEEVFLDVSMHIVRTASIRYNIRLTWGGNWKFKDMPHFQI